MIDSRSIFVFKDEWISDLDNIRDILLKTELDSIKMFWQPEISEKFLINLDNDLFRAMRTPLSDQKIDKNAYMQIRLQDTGETFLMSTKEFDDGFYIMPEEIISIPALAFKCICDRVFDINNVHEVSTLKNNVYQQCTIEVVQVTPEIIVNMWPFDQSSSNDLIEQDDDTDSECSLRDASTKNESANESKLNTSISQGINRKTLTEKQLAELFEEPLNTESALVAVQGFETKDDENICRFYDAKTGGCFKGARCKQIHSPQLKDGFEVRDKEEVFLEGYTETSLLKIHEYFDIKILQFITWKRFICRLIDGVEETLKINDLLNDAIEISHYDKVLHMPCVFQLVIVKIKERFFRARVENESDKQDVYSVFLVDEGTFELVNFNAIFNWSPRFQYIPFQALEMEIAGVQSEKCDMEAVSSKIFEIQQQSAQPIKAFLV